MELYKVVVIAPIETVPGMKPWTGLGPSHRTPNFRTIWARTRRASFATMETASGLKACPLAVPVTSKST